MSESDDFDWSPLGEKFWRSAAEACQHKPSEQQLRFAVCKWNGLNASDSAAKAGYEGDDAAIRVGGHRASKSTAVAELLAYAHAETGKGDDGIVSSSEARRILSRISRKGNNNERIKALEALGRLDQGYRGGDTDASKMSLSDLLPTAVLLGCDDGQYRPELSPLIWAEMIVPQEVWWAPMVRQMAPYLNQHHPEIWAIARKHLAQWRPDDLQRLEAGPVLTAAQIHDITAKNIASLLVVVDSNGDVEARTAAFENLRKIGLIESEGTFCPPPIEPILVTWKRCTGEDQRESILRVGDVSNDTIDPGVGSRYEGLLHQSDASIIEDPDAGVLVGPNDIDRIHAVRPCGRSFIEF